MFLRCTNRKKDGKDHRYWSVVENRRVSGGRVVQRHVLYLGEINDSQRESWRKTIEVFEDGYSSAKTVALFPEDRPVEIDDEQVVQIRLKDVELRHPRQWGACWLARWLYKQLELDEFWARRLLPSRKGTRWDLIIQALCCCHHRSRRKPYSPDKISLWYSLNAVVPFGPHHCLYPFTCLFERITSSNLFSLNHFFLWPLVFFDSCFLP